MPEQTVSDVGVREMSDAALWQEIARLLRTPSPTDPTEYADLNRQYKQTRAELSRRTSIAAALAPEGAPDAAS